MGQLYSSTSSSVRTFNQPTPSVFAPLNSQRPLFNAIGDNYTTLEQVQQALRKEGLESCNLIIAVDLTKSNEWTGQKSFRGKCLHHIGAEANPYEEAMTIIGKTLSAFDDDGLIPVYGFGDVTTQDKAVFSFKHGDEPCQGLDSVVWRYRELMPHVKLAGPTSFGPAIMQAMDIVARSDGQYHILLIIADGQVTRSSDLPVFSVSPQEAATIKALQEASQYPLSIIMVGVGDGPWEQMKEFDDRLPTRAFDNFQFVNFTEIQTLSAHRYPHEPERRDALFALRALMEIPQQYKFIQTAGLLGKSLPRPSTYTVLNPPGPRANPSPSVQLPQMNSPASQKAASLASPASPLATSQSLVRKPESSSSGVRAPIDSPKTAGPSDIDSLFMCPITQDIMQDPVIAADGYTYERDAITKWLSSNKTSPMTGGKLPHTNLIPNHALRSSIREYTERRKSVH